MFVNYPKFTYKRAFRFVYKMLNLYRNCKQIGSIYFEPDTFNDIELIFRNALGHIEFHYYDTKTIGYGDDINLSKELTAYKREFYDSVFRYFFGYKEVKKINYKAIDKYVPFKPIIPR